MRFFAGLSMSVITVAVMQLSFTGLTYGVGF